MMVLERGSPAVTIRRAGPDFSVSTWSSGDEYVVELAGELDLAARDHVLAGCLGGGDRDVAVLLDRVNFMDCAGYGALCGARNEVAARGHSLTLHGATGSAARLLSLLPTEGGSL